MIKIASDFYPHLMTSLSKSINSKNIKFKPFLVPFTNDRKFSLKLHIRSYFCPR